ncbi:MAG TPA: hypothetical protein PKD55_01450 [Bellilinea sp.]|nr:hypothetical protein [Bellilinea sp.]
MDRRIELKKCHTLVWRFREKYSLYWATPDPLTALRFAFTEAGKAMDAYIRSTTGRTYSRNNERNNDVLDELADCAIMLISSNENYQDSIWAHDADADIDWICGLVGRALTYQTADEEFKYTALGAIASYPGMSLLENINARLERIYQKHVRVKA